MREADQPADRGEVDDRATAALTHPAGRRLAAVERAAEVDRDHVLPLLRGHRVDVADLAHSGAVDEDVDPARRRDTCSIASSTAAAERTSTVTEQRLPRSRRAKRLDHRLPRLLRAVEDRRSARPRRRRAMRSHGRCRSRHRSPRRSCRSGARRPPLLRRRDSSPSSIAHVEATEEQAATWAITGARHGGITVSDLDRSLEFYCGLVGLELVWRGELPAPVIGRIVGVPEATGFDIAFLRIPGSETQVELLEYRGIEQESGATSPARPRHRPLLRLRPRTSTPSTPISPRRASASAPTGRSRCRRARTRAARASTRSTPTGTSSNSTSGRPMPPPDATIVAGRPPGGRRSSSSTAGCS